MRSDEYSSPKRILDARQLRPRKRFGQNFLTDPRVADRIAMCLPSDAYAIEIGGGTGTLTAALLSRVRALTTLEIDRDLSALLHERFATATQLQIVTADALQFDFAAELRGERPPRVICGNLPYYITTPLLEQILSASEQWEIALLMVQKEYAQRLVALPGSRSYSSLTVFASHFVKVEKLLEVGAAGFYPSPAVASSVVRLTPKPRTHHGQGEPLLLGLIRAAFRHRRKTLVNSVLESLPGAKLPQRQAIESALGRLGLPPNVRGERLSLADYYALADILKELGFSETSWTTQQPHAR